MTTDYPVCEALAARAPERAILHNFIQWLEEQNVSFVKSFEDGGNAFLTQTSDSLILEYFGIDEQKLEEERRHILENCT